MCILLAEQDKKTTWQMASSLSELDYGVEIVHEPHLVQETLKSKAFDLIVLDASFKTPHSIEIMREFFASGGNTPIVFTVPRAKFDTGIQALKNGAHDYILKPLIIREFTARVQALIFRNLGYRQSVVRLGPLQFDLFSRTASIGHHILELTRREKGVLEVLIKRSGQLVSKQSIKSYFDTIDEDISLKAIETYVYRLRKKIKHPEIIIKTVWGTGYILQLKKLIEVTQTNINPV